VERTPQASHTVLGYPLAPDRDAEEAIGRVDGHLHGDADAICPRCLRWIDPREFVRQTAFGLLQHEVCPP
jgi:hypothetical protein